MHARSMGRSIEIISLKVSLLPVHGAYVKNAALGKRYKTLSTNKEPGQSRCLGVGEDPGIECRPKARWQRYLVSRNVMKAGSCSITSTANCATRS